MSTAEIETPEVDTPSIVDEPLFEVVGDDYVELIPMVAKESLLTTEIGFMIRQLVKRHDLGIAAVETLFRIRANPNLQRRPDAAFVSYERWAKGREIPAGNFWDVVPDLVVEVVSPTDFAGETLAKIHEYFAMGVRLAWLVFPGLATIYVFESPRSIRVFGREETLDGGVVLPGFQLSLIELFGPEKPNPV